MNLPHRDDREELDQTVSANHPDAGPSSPKFSVGDRINDTYMVRHYVSGGMSDVYLCIGLTASSVAFKFPKPGRGGRTGAQRRDIILEEAKNWAELGEHPNVVDCLYAGTSEDRWFLVLDWVGYPDLPEDIRDMFSRRSTSNSGTLETDLIRVADEICAGLEYIHGFGIIHGDIKPSNLLVDKNEHIKISDLGIGMKSTTRASKWRRFVRKWRRFVRHVQTSTAYPIQGTYQYMAPELWDGEPATVQTDIYAFGCVLYELASKRPPFDATNVAELSRKHRTETPPLAPGVGGDLGRLIANCLSKHPSRRPNSITTVRNQLEKISLSRTDNSRATAKSASTADKDHRPEYVRDMQNVSLKVAAGRTGDAIRQQTAVIRDAMMSWDTNAGKYIDGEPSGILAWLFNDRGILVASQDILAASLDFITALRLNRKFSAAYSNLGTCHQKLNLPTLAVTAFGRAIDLDPEDYRHWLRRAQLYSELGWAETAYSDYERALSIAPDQAETCWGMADALFALGRENEASVHREKSRELGGSGSFNEWLRPGRLPRESGQLTWLAEEEDQQAAIKSFSLALETDYSNLRARYRRAKAYLDSEEYVNALHDINVFLNLASTTDPRIPAAEEIRDRLLEATGEAVGHNPTQSSIPMAKSSDYVARRVGKRVSADELANWLPVSAQQRFVLFDMLHSGDADRRLKAVRLVWLAFDEEIDRRKAVYQEMAHGVAEESAPVIAGKFTECVLWGDIVMRNGLGIPLLLTEAQLASNPIQYVQFADSEPLAVGWHSHHAVGIWNIVPAFERDCQTLHGETKVLGILSDGSAYLLARGDAVAVLASGTPEEDDSPVTGWQLSPSDKIVSAYVTDTGQVAIGLSNSTIVLLPTGGSKGQRLKCSKEDNEVYLGPGIQGELCVYSNGEFFRVSPVRGQENAFQLTRLSDSKIPPTSKLIFFDGKNAILALSTDEIAVVNARSGNVVRLRPRDSTDDEGFLAAAISTDGSLVAAVCGSYLHVWKFTDADAGFSPLPITPQTRGQCVTVSADGSYVVVGTSVGSIAIFRLGEVGEGDRRGDQ